MSEFFNDNAVPHGGFIASFSVGGFVKLERFTIDDPGKVILRPDEIGSPNGWAGVDDQQTASATAQIPTSGGSSLTKGAYFIAPAALGGAKWVITHLSTPVAMGEYWKQEVSFHRSYST